MTRHITICSILILMMISSACSFVRRQPGMWHLTLELVGETTNRQAAIERAVNVIESRLNSVGLTGFKVLPYEGTIEVNLPKVADHDRIKNIVTNEGRLEVFAVIGPPVPAPPQIYPTKEAAIASLNSGGTVPTNRRVLPFSEPSKSQGWMVVESPPLLDADAYRTFNAIPSRSATGDYQIQFSVLGEAAGPFGEWTGHHVNNYFAVALNDEIRSVPFIRSQIFDQGELTGHFTKESAEDLAQILKGGALPAPLRIVKED